MTSTQKSSGDAARKPHYSGIESLAGVHHPHAIEIQEFSNYAQIVDLRSPTEYGNDHIPGAVRIEPPANFELDKVSSWVEWAQTAAASDTPSRSRKPTLIYCGNAGKVSQAAAEAMRGHGMNIDVLPGGWINYRRWVQAGVEILPRLITLRVIQTPMGLDSLRLLKALRSGGRQVLDIERLTGGDSKSCPTQAGGSITQAWFESQLLHQLRGFDPSLHVWTVASKLPQGRLSIPGSLGDCLRMAPTAAVEVGALSLPRSDRAESADRGKAVRLPPLMVTSFETKALLAGLTAWLPMVEPHFLAG